MLTFVFYILNFEYFRTNMNLHVLFIKTKYTMFILLIMFH